MSQIDFEGLIAQLAFGKTMPSHIPALGMYIGLDAVYLAETDFGEDGGLRVKHLVRVPLSTGPNEKNEAASRDSPTTGSTIDRDFLSENARAVDILKQSLSQPGWATKNVVMTLSHQLSILRYFTMPHVERKFLKSAVPLQAKKYIPLPFESLSHDFQVFPLPSDSGQGLRDGALFGVTAKNNLGRIYDFAQKLGLQVLSVEMACLSTLRFWKKARRGAGANVFCCVHFDGGDIRIILVANGIPVFFREISLGVQPSLQDQRRLDLDGCVSFAQKQLGIGGVEAVFVSGGGTPLENWRDAFARELGAKAVICDEAAPLGLKQGAWEGYAALGASLRFVTASPIIMDLGKIGKVGDDEVKTARTILAVSLLVTLWFMAIGLFNFFSYRLRTGELAQYRVDPAIDAVLQGKTKSDISDLLKSMRLQLSALQGISLDKTSPSAILKDIGDFIPNDVWVSNIAYEDSQTSNAMAAYDGESSGPSLNLQGSSQANAVIDEQNAIYKFRDDLSASPVIGKIFKQIQVQIQGGNQNSATSRVTTFVMNMTQQKPE